MRPGLSVCFKGQYRLRQAFMMARPWIGAGEGVLNRDLLSKRVGSMTQDWRGFRPVTSLNLQWFPLRTREA